MDLLSAITFWTGNIGDLLLATNVLIGIVQRKQLPPFFQSFTLFLATGMVIRAIALILWYQSRNNLPLLHLYTLLEFIFLSLFYRSLLNELQLKYFPHFIGLTAVLIVLNSLFIQPLTGFNSIAKTFTQVVYICYALLYFFGPARRDQTLLNLINSAVLIYYSASLFIFMFTNVLSSLKDLIPFYDYLWIVNIFLDIVFQSMVLYALWKTGWRQTKYSP